MATWAIGDLQGCYDVTQRLLERIRFDPAVRRDLERVGDHEDLQGRSGGPAPIVLGLDGEFGAPRGRGDPKELQGGRLQLDAGRKGTFRDRDGVRRLATGHLQAGVVVVAEANLGEGSGLDREVWDRRLVFATREQEKNADPPPPTLQHHRSFPLRDRAPSPSRHSRTAPIMTKIGVVKPIAVASASEMCVTAMNQSDRPRV